MSDYIYLIKNDNYIESFYSDLELAKEELIKIYKKTIDFKYYGYFINEYIQKQVMFINLINLLK